VRCGIILTDFSAVLKYSHTVISPHVQYRILSHVLFIRCAINIRNCLGPRVRLGKWFVLLSFADHAMTEAVILAMTAIMTLIIQFGPNTLAHSFCSA